MGITGIYDLLGSGIIKCGFCEYEYHIKSKIEDDVEYIFYKHNNKNCCLHSKILEIENINEIFKVFYSTYYKIFDEIKIIIQNNQEMWKVNLNEYSKKVDGYNSIIQTLTKKIINCSDLYPLTYFLNLLINFFRYYRSSILCGTYYVIHDYTYIVFLSYYLTHTFIILLLSPGASSGVLNRIGFANKSPTSPNKYVYASGLSALGLHNG
jgi:hypothetical protein